MWFNEELEDKIDEVSQYIHQKQRGNMKKKDKRNRGLLQKVSEHLTR